MKFLHVVTHSPKLIDAVLAWLAQFGVCICIKQLLSGHEIRCQILGI